MNLSYLFAAFALAWIAVLFYVTSLARRGRELEREVAELRALLDERGSPRSEQ